MKRFLAFALVMSLGLFTLGCGPSSTPSKKTGTAPAGSAAVKGQEVKGPTGPVSSPAPGAAKPADQK